MQIIKNDKARVLCLAMGSVLVLCVSGCAFSGPGTHVGGNGLLDEVVPEDGGEKVAKPTPPDDDEDWILT